MRYNTDLTPMTPVKKNVMWSSLSISNKTWDYSFLFHVVECEMHNPDLYIDIWSMYLLRKLEYFMTIYIYLKHCVVLRMRNAPILWASTPSRQKWITFLQMVTATNLFSSYTLSFHTWIKPGSAKGLSQSNQSAPGSSSTSDHCCTSSLNLCNTCGVATAPHTSSKTQTLQQLKH